MLRQVLVIFLSCTALAACATSSVDVPPNLDHATSYDDLACQELAAERSRVRHEIHRVSQKIDSSLLGKRIKIGVGVTVFWPALLLIGEQDPDHDTLARLKGERVNLRESMNSRGCPVTPPASV